MEASVAKGRTSSRCREWERKRRNKFNDAISRLGEIVKEIHKANRSLLAPAEEAENVQYPKVEIVEKAIIYLTALIQEKAQLKGEILALQVKIESDKNQKENKKDVSTQVFTGMSKKPKSDKFVKSVILIKPKRKKLQKNQPAAKDIEQRGLPKLPVLVPKSNLNNNKKGPENAIVVLPAAPYIFPQRPLLLPSVPPAFVLVEHNLQTLNKHSFPIINRNNSDVTKTTMVNILPISAYSRPLSVMKSKKNAKSKTVINKKVKKSKEVLKTTENPIPTDTSKTKLPEEVETEKTQEESCKDGNKETQLQEIKTSECSKEKKEVKKDAITIPSTNISAIKNVTNNDIPKSTNAMTVTTLEEKSKVVKVADTPKAPVSPKETIQTDNANIPAIPTTSITDNIMVEKTRTDKIPADKHTASKDKETKLANILDTTLCESAVDGGNARLELAEEFLAASPTAAFLMSFPLVSGNRADSPAEETPNPIQINNKENAQRRPDITSHSLPYFEKTYPSETKTKAQVDKSAIPSSTLNKQNEHLKYVNNSNISKDNVKTPITAVTTNVSNENPFLNLSMSALLPTTCTLSDTTFGLDFECNISKSMPSQSSSYVNNSNFFYKSDPFSTVKSTIYSTSSISSGHEFNSFGLYPCAMEKYTSKNKTDYANVEDNLMKIGSSRLTYDIDLGWSHKGFDFVSCTSASNTFNKDTILTTTSGSYSSSYNPFNPDFHVPLVSTSNKKDSFSSKATTSYPDAITSFYSQPSGLWSEEVPFYANNNSSKPLTSKHQNYLPADHTQMNLKQNNSKQYESKLISNTGMENVNKPQHSETTQHQEKYKKSPSKMHINWMTSEVRPMQNNCNPTHSELKDTHKPIYSHLDQASKKQDLIENNYFPISMHNFPAQSVQEELLVCPSVRPAGTTEISIEPPPINLPTLVGDLALGPHDKKKTTELANRGANQTDIQNCSNFFSVTQLMNRSTDNNIPTRYQGATNATSIQNFKPKQNMSHTTSDHSRKPMSNTESHIPQPCYVFNESKTVNSFENMNQFSHNKAKTSKPDKNSKAQKNNYSAEALIRGGTCNQKLQDNNSSKFMVSSQKYNEFNAPQDSSIAQVSHFPPILDYSDATLPNSYAGQQFSGTNLYNTTTNTISNSFYSNLMPGNYTSGPFSGDFIDYNQTPECSYPNHKYTELKMRNQPTMFQQEKIPSNYKSSRRESAAKHKLECSKKDSNKKCPSKRAKVTNEAEEWSDSTAHLLWQNKGTNRRHGNLMSDELAFPNYVGNQMAAATAQYQPEFFNSHIMPANMQPVGHNVDRSLASFPVTSRANFNLSTIFPEITMKVQ